MAEEAIWTLSVAVTSVALLQRLREWRKTESILEEKVIEEGQEQNV